MHQEQTTGSRSSIFARLIKEFVSVKWPIIFHFQGQCWIPLFAICLHAFANRQRALWLDHQTSANRRRPWSIFLRTPVRNFAVLRVTSKQLDFEPQCNWIIYVFSFILGYNFQKCCCRLAVGRCWLAVGRLHAKYFGLLVVNNKGKVANFYNNIHMTWLQLLLL